MSRLRNITVASTPLFDTPGEDGSLQTECLFGEQFSVDRESDGWAFGETVVDQYQGWLDLADLGEPGDNAVPSHRVSALRTVATTTPSVKSKTSLVLPFNACVKVVAKKGRQAEIAIGGEAGTQALGKTAFVPMSHLVEFNHVVEDWVATAERFIGVPYRWGGRNANAVDCSALVQLSLQSGGIRSPRNSGDQQRELGEVLSDTEKVRRGDLVFWPGHVGVMLDELTLLHANAFHRQVYREPLSDVVERSLHDEGPVSAVKRLSG